MADAAGVVSRLATAGWLLGLEATRRRQRIRGDDRSVSLPHRVVSITVRLGRPLLPNERQSKVRRSSW